MYIYIVAVALLPLALTSFAQSAAQRPPTVSNSDAQALVFQTLRFAEVEIPIGRFSIVDGASNWRTGTIQKSAAAWAEAAAKTGALRTRRESSSGKSWIIISETSGDSFRVTTPQVLVTKGVRAANVSNIRVTNNETMTTPSGQYQMVHVEYSSTWLPIAEAYMAATGEKFASSRKAAFLYRWDEESGRWQPPARVVANASEQLDMTPLRRVLDGPAPQLTQKQELDRDADAKAQRLVDKHHANGWIPWAQVSANVYAHEGKVYLVPTRFYRMVSADTAQFGDGVLTKAVLVVGVPTTAFVEEKAVVVVGKMKPSKEEGGGLSLRMQYLGHEFCVQASCDDFGKARPASK